MKRKAIFLLYRVVETLAAPLLALYLLVRIVRDRRYLPTLRERLGALPALWQKTVPEAIWLHAVSVGEVLAAVPLIEDLRRRLPGAPIFVSTTTLAGRETADKRLSALTDGIFYAPIDYVWIVRRVLRRIRPSVVVILETEIWPNLYREVNRIGCGLVLVNGRISDRALPRYQRYAPFFSAVLSLCDRILVQSQEMNERFLQVGAPAEIVSTGGNLKYDFRLTELSSDSPIRTFAAAGEGKPLWIAASTSSDGRIDEEDDVIAAQQALPGWRLIIAPRKPERFGTVAEKLKASGLRWTRRTEFSDPAADVLLLDSIGELGGAFTLADAVFMGGTLAEMGGHNILEPALAAKPVIAGPHLENFREIEQHFTKHKAVMRIAQGSELAAAVRAADAALGQRGYHAAMMQRGAAERAADAVVRLYESRYPCERCAQPAYFLLACLAEVWRAGSFRDRMRKRARARSLPVAVVSVGNITTGGTGKTPVTLELARDLAERKPGVLMRGHGRHSRGVVVVRAGESASTGLTGDEAQLYLRANVSVGIGAERAQAGEELLRQTEAGVLILDDGFQHLQLRRNFDLVVVDALHAFGGSHLLPLGRLREPMRGLMRANAFVVTRSNAISNAPAIAATLRRYNATAPVYFAHIENRCWKNAAGETREPTAFAETRAVAFCGIGNPQSFWHSLEEAGIEPTFRHFYGDHHRYTPMELRRLARHAQESGAEVLLTTEKDIVNLGADYEEVAAPLKVWWLEIGIVIEGRDDLIARIRKSLDKQ